MQSCKACNRRVQMNRSSCLYCGATVPPPAKDNYYLKCPRCQGTLTEEVLDGLLLDVCHSCGGTWYDKTELEARLEHHLKGESEPTANGGHQSRTHAPWPSSGQVEYLLCPQCQKPMVPKNHGRNSGVIVDICGYHGVFLDSGEFDRLLEFEEEGGSKKASALEERRAKARAREVKRDLKAVSRRSSDYVLAHRRFLPFFR